MRRTSKGAFAVSCCPAKPGVESVGRDAWEGLFGQPTHASVTVQVSLVQGVWPMAWCPRSACSALAENFTYLLARCIIMGSTIYLESSRSASRCSIAEAVFRFHVRLSRGCDPLLVPTLYSPSPRPSATALHIQPRGKRILPYLSTARAPSSRRPPHKTHTCTFRASPALAVSRPHSRIHSRLLSLDHTLAPRGLALQLYAITHVA